MRKLKRKMISKHFPIMFLSWQMSISVLSTIWFADTVPLSLLSDSCIYPGHQQTQAITMPTSTRWLCWVGTWAQHCSFTGSLPWSLLTSKILYYYYNLILFHQNPWSDFVCPWDCVSCHHFIHLIFKLWTTTSDLTLTTQQTHFILSHTQIFFAFIQFFPLYY